MNGCSETKSGVPTNYRTPRRFGVSRHLLGLLLGIFIFAITSAYADTFTLVQDALQLRQKGEYARSVERFTQALEDDGLSAQDRGLIYYYRGTNFDSAGQPSR